MPRASLRDLSLLFLRIGNTTLGGGEPTIAALQRELIRRGWLTPEQFGVAFALARITPGTNMLAFSAAAGWYILGLAGALCGVLAVTIPSSLLVVWLTGICEAGAQIAWLGAVVAATIAAALGIMAAAALLLIRSQFGSGHWAIPLLIAAAAFGLRFLGLTPIEIIALAAIAGLFWRQA
jgi:chromate transporter